MKVLIIGPYGTADGHPLETDTQIRRYRGTGSVDHRLAIKRDKPVRIRTSSNYTQHFFFNFIINVINSEFYQSFGFSGHRQSEFSVN